MDKKLHYILRLNSWDLLEKNDKRYCCNYGLFYPGEKYVPWILFVYHALNIIIFVMLAFLMNRNSGN